MKSLRLLLVVALLLGLANGFAPVHAGGCTSKTGYYVASLSSDIDPSAVSFMSTTVASAEVACDGNIVFILSTSGGDEVSIQPMVDSISSYQQWGGNFTTLVAPRGAFAFFAGSYIAEASNKIYMVSGTMIGSATPPGEENTTTTKVTSAFTSYMETLTAANGRNSTAAGLMVSQGVSYTDAEAAMNHVINARLDATSIEGALSALGVPASTPINTPGISSTVTTTATATSTITSTAISTTSTTSKTTTTTTTTSLSTSTASTYAYASLGATTVVILAVAALAAWVLRGKRP